MLVFIACGIVSLIVIEVLVDLPEGLPIYLFVSCIVSQIIKDSCVNTVKDELIQQGKLTEKADAKAVDNHYSTDPSFSIYRIIYHVLFALNAIAFCKGVTSGDLILYVIIPGLALYLFDTVFKVYCSKQVKNPDNVLDFFHYHEARFVHTTLTILTVIVWGLGILGFIVGAGIWIFMFVFALDFSIFFL